MPPRVDPWGASAGKTLIAIEKAAMRIRPRAYDGIEYRTKAVAVPA